MSREEKEEWIQNGMSEIPSNIIDKEEKEEEEEDEEQEQEKEQEKIDDQ